MQSTELIEHARLLSEVASALTALRADVDRIRQGEIAKPVREVVPVSLHVQELALQCTRQLHDLSISQYATTKRGEQNLAHLVGACSQISLAATLCNLATQHRTDVLLYDDADPTPAASRDQLRRASAEIQQAAVTYHAMAFRLSRRLASPAAPRQGQHTMADGSAVTLLEPASAAVVHARR